MRLIIYEFHKEIDNMLSKIVFELSSTATSIISTYFLPYLHESSAVFFMGIFNGR